MEYTVNGLARLAGVSVRTLHWYDEIGLLRPARVTEAGYRMYGPDEVDALQSILFYRALGVPLKQIGALMADASAGRLAALQSHRAVLSNKAPRTRPVSFSRAPGAFFAALRLLLCRPLRPHRLSSP